MKISSQKLLLLLSITREKGLSQSELPFVWPHLSPSGRRSLLWLLQHQGLVILKNSLPPQIVMTAVGRQTLQELFPSPGSGEQGRWYLCIRSITSPPKQDDRAVEKELAGWLRLASRIYLGREDQAHRLRPLLISARALEYYLARVEEFEFGDIPQLVRERLSISASVAIFSGISSEIAQLIRLENKNTVPKDQAKRNFFSVFDRFFTTWQASAAAVIWSAELFSSSEKVCNQFSEWWQTL